MTHENLIGGCLDEREAFEAHYAQIWKKRGCKTQSLPELVAVLVSMRDGDEYDNSQGVKPAFINDMWQAFKAGRASLPASKQAGGAESVIAAWQERQRNLMGWTSWYECKSTCTVGKTAPFAQTSGGIPYEFRPLYAAPNQPGEQQ